MRSLIFFLSTICAFNVSASIAFQKQVGDQRLIVVADDQGQNQRVISDPNQDTYHPEMSSSGRYVAYTRGKIRPGVEVSTELVIKDLKTGDTEIWTPKGNQYIHAEFSGNDRFLVFSGINEKNDRQNIMIIDLKAERAKGAQQVTLNSDGTLTYDYDPRLEIIESDFDCYAPAVASNGSFVIYHRTMDKSDKSAPKQLMQYNRGTQETKELTDSTRHAMFPTLSADDQYVAYVSKDGGEWDIYLYDLWSDKVSQVTNDNNREFTPVFSSDNRLYFTRFFENGNEFEIDIYYLTPEEVFGQAKALPKAFLSEEKVFEYVISFSNPYELRMTKAPSFLNPERSSFGSVFHKDKIYITGGHQGPEHTYPKESFLDVLEVYDMKTKTWSSLAPMKLAKHGFQMVAFENYLYVFGGFTFSEDHLPKWKSVNTIERYDIKKNKWEVLPQRLPNNRSSNALAVVNNQVYLIGGWDSTPKFANDKEGRFLKEIDVFNLKTETVSTSDMKMPEPLRRAFTAVAVEDDIYLLGGIGEGSSHFEWIDNVTVMSPLQKSWREEAPLPFATFAPGAGQIDGHVYLFGGMIIKDLAKFDINYVDDIYRLDANKKTWSHSGLYLERNKGFPQVVPLPGKRLGILGGHTYEKTPSGIIDHPVKSFEVLNQ